MFPVHDTKKHYNKKPAFSNSFGLKSIFENLCFRYELAWTIDLTVETKLRFQISEIFQSEKEVKKTTYF